MTDRPATEPPDWEGIGSTDPIERLRERATVRWAGPWDEWEGLLNAALAEAAQGAAPRDSPFRRVVDDSTEGDGCACHTGIGYNTACRHCQPQMSEGAAPRAEGLDRTTVAKVLHALTVGPGGLASCFHGADGSECSYHAALFLREYARLSRPSDERDGHPATPEASDWHGPCTKCGKPIEYEDEGWVHT